MARNLQSKLPSSDTLRVFDINAQSTQKFAEETKALGTGAAVTIATSVREAAEDSVSFPESILVYEFLPRIPYMMSLFYP